MNILTGETGLFSFYVILKDRRNQKGNTDVPKAFLKGGNKRGGKIYSLLSQSNSLVQTVNLNNGWKFLSVKVPRG